MLTVKNVTKKYGSFTALEDVNIEFGIGVHALLAPNGAGKTTLMKMLTTLMKPNAGEILYNEENIFLLDDKYRDVLGYLPQSFGFYKGYTVRQFLLYLAALKGLGKKQANEKIDELLANVGLSDAASLRMKKLSGGMLQRVGIAQALLNDPQVLILDEPTAGLDPKERVRFRNMLSELGKTKTVILSTHIVSDVESIASRVILIKNHKLLCNETVQQLCSQLNGKVFERTAAVALHDGEVFLSERQDANGLVNRFVSHSVPADASPVNAGLEDVFLYVYGEEIQ